MFYCDETETDRTDNGLAGRPVDIINRNQRLPATEPATAGKMSENERGETGHYATAEMTGPGDRFMGGVKKWPGPLNRVIKCRYFKQRLDPNVRELYLPDSLEFSSSELAWKFVRPFGDCFLADINKLWRESRSRVIF